MKYLFAILFIGLLSSCTTSNIPDNKVIENVVYDVPFKSQVSIRLELTGAYTQAQVKELCEMTVRISKEKNMKYHPTPTHIFIYIYKSKEDCQKDGGSWIAMYSKRGAEDSGDYTYRN